MFKKFKERKRRARILSDRISHKINKFKDIADICEQTLWDKGLNHDFVDYAELYKFNFSSLYKYMGLKDIDVRGSYCICYNTSIPLLKRPQAENDIVDALISADAKYYHDNGIDTIAPHERRFIVKLLSQLLGGN